MVIDPPSGWRRTRHRLERARALAYLPCTIEEQGMDGGNEISHGPRLITEGEWAGWRSWTGDPFETQSGPYYFRAEEDGAIRCAFRAERKHMNGGASVPLSASISRGVSTLSSVISTSSFPTTIRSVMVSTI